MKIPRPSIYCALALCTYCALVFPFLSQFPPYFFCDEAIHGLEADALIHTGKDIAGESFPVVFRGFGEYALALTVYLQTPFTFLFGTSEFAVRVRTALLSLVGVWGAGLLLGPRHTLLSGPFTWLVFGICPIWLLHSRTGFEYIPAASFYLAFLGLYARALDCGGVSRSVGAAVLACCTFYSYSPARGWTAASVTLLLLVNLRRHAQQWKHSALYLLTFALLMAPYLVFHAKNPVGAMQRLTSLNAANVGHLSLREQLEHILSNYQTVLNPGFWFTLAGSIDGEVERHIIPGMSAIPWWLLPFCLFGFGLALASIGRIQSRACLVALIATPFPAVLVSVNHQRTIAFGAVLMVFSIAGLSAAVSGLDLLLRAKGRVTRVVQLFLVGYAAWLGLFMHQRAAQAYSRYAFYGLEYGPKQLFAWIEEHQPAYDRIYLSQGIFTQPESLARFFLSAQAHTKMHYPFFEELCNGKIPIGAGSEGTEVWVVSQSSFELHRAGGCPITLEPVDRLNSPDGKPYLQLVRVVPRPGLDQWLQKSREAEESRRRARYNTRLLVKGQTVDFEHPMLANGNSPAPLFDGKSSTVVRTDEINPGVFRLSMPSQPLSRVVVVLSNTTQAVAQVATGLNGQATAWGERQYQKGKDTPELEFRSPHDGIVADSIEIKITLPDWGPRGSPHIAEIYWN